MSDSDDPLRKDVDSGLRFLHVMGMQTRADLYDTSARMYALIEELVAKGQLDLRSLDERKEKIRAKEIERARNQANVVITDVTDKYQLKDLPPVPCEELIPICKGRCCTLVFPLSFQDLDERVVKWDYAHPYRIRQGPDGYCVHSNSETRGCGVYQHRPAVCRTYDCRGDKRIWIDYEKRIAAPFPPSGPAPEEKKVEPNEKKDS